MNFEKIRINQQQWCDAGQRLIEIAIAEFLYEEIIQVMVLEQYRFRLHLDTLIYEFQGFQYQLGHWYIQQGSVRCISTHPMQPAWDLHAFLAAFLKQSGVSSFTQAYFIKEMNSTWLAEAHLMGVEQLLSTAVLSETHDKIEGMLRGHPWLVMNKGRMGFAYDDYLSAAPELSPTIQVLWLAVHMDLAHYRSTSGWPANALYQHELNQEQLEAFHHYLQAKGLSSLDYFFIPVHIWQWHQWIIPTYANEIVARRIVELDLSIDQYIPTQSVRTLYNISHTQRHFIKLPVSILNTAVYRGLPSARNLAAPAVTEWLQGIYNKDIDLQNTGVKFLGEIATLTIEQPCFDQINAAPYQFKELFGCLWRESINPLIDPQHLALSQAALLHRDISGQSILNVLIQASGLSPLQWLKQFADVCMRPLLLCLYKYGLAFSAHGENTWLIHEHGIPKQIVIKDLIDDLNLVNDDFPELNDLPDEGQVLLRHSAAELSHFIFTGLFMVHYRYICNVFLEDFPKYTEIEFWQCIADVIVNIHHDYPELAERIKKFDIFRHKFEKICLNRVRLFTTSYHDEAERPVPVLLKPMANPVSPNTLALWSKCDVPPSIINFYNSKQADIKNIKI